MLDRHLRSVNGFVGWLVRLYEIYKFYVVHKFYAARFYVISEMVLRGRLNGSQRMRLGKLLDMLYTCSELAAEIGFTVRQMYRVYVPLGCPVSRDARQRLWINGVVFADWYESTYPKQTLLEDEAFCLTCKKAVKISGPVKQVKGRLSYWVCKCSGCGRKLARIIDKEKR